MSCRVRLILAFHNHQPIGNFDGVFEDAYARSYLPFLELLEQFPEIPVVLHNSGSLLEWLQEQRPEYIDRLRALVARGQVELLGGPYYEPILASLPQRDRVGQMIAYRRHLERLFETKIRGMWMPERVWEQTFASDIADAGLEYTLLDDTHFKNAGLVDDQLHGYYLSENNGKLIKVFAGSERLRYLIPFKDPQATIDHVGFIAERAPGSVLVFGDDGEKFGVWPGSFDLVWRDGWLRRFFELLSNHRHWIKITTGSETLDEVAPQGRIYLPDSSYREMNEWSLPTERQKEYREAVAEASAQPYWSRLQPFVRAGNWRNFLVKYPEAGEMYARMLTVSQTLQELDHASLSPEGRRLVARARRELYRAQCNCPYWHGAFGGLYLPHLRNAIYGRLIEADSLLQRARGKLRRWVEADARDFDLDSRNEIRLAGERLVAFLAPGRGGHLYELDDRAVKLNLLATLERRPEPYHDRIREAVRSGQQSSTGGGVDPNGAVCCKQDGLDEKLQSDYWPRKSLVDHVLRPGLTFSDWAAGRGHVGDFANGAYAGVLRRARGRVEARLSREGSLGPYRIRVAKTISLSAGDPNTITAKYELSQLPREVPIHFGVEFNFAAMPAGAQDRYYYDQRGRRVGNLGAQLQLPRQERLGMVDEWLGLDVCLDTSVPADIWSTPIQTVSQSEAGFELIHQSCAVLPHWQFFAGEDGRWEVTLTLSIDSSAAQARLLSSVEARPEGRLTLTGA